MSQRLSFQPKHMKYLFEIYMTADEITADHWRRFHDAIVTQIGVFTRYEIVFRCQDNTARYFIACDFDVSQLAQRIDGIILKPSDSSEVQLPQSVGHETSVRIASGEDLLSLRRRHSVKYGSELTYARIHIQPLGPHITYAIMSLYFLSRAGIWTGAKRFAALLPVTLMSVRIDKHSNVAKQKLPKYMNLVKSLHMLNSEAAGALFAVPAFPYRPGNLYLPLTAYDFDKHSLIVGASGSGKSQLISLMINRLFNTALRMNYRVIVIDPHASLEAELTSIPDQRVVTFGAEDGTELFPGSETDLSSAVELTATLFKSILEDQFNPRLDRLLRFSLFSLMTAQTMSLEHLKRFLTQAAYRNDIMAHVQHYIPDNVHKFFGTDFNELRSQYYETTIMPLVTMIDEMQLQPSLTSRSETSLAKLVQENFLTVFSLNRLSMGDKTLKTVAGLLIQQIFLLAQSRVFGQKIILIIDEVSVVQNPALAQILAEARKFNLTIILTQQYFGQIVSALREAIFANAYNYYMFKVSEADATALAGNVGMDLPKELLMAEKAKGVSNAQLKVKFLTELSPRECLVRVMCNGQLGPCILARTVDAPAPAAHASPARLKVAQRLPQRYTGQVVHVDSLAPKTQATDDLPTPGRSFGGLGDLLRQHSSSRLNQRTKRHTNKS